MKTKKLDLTANLIALAAADAAHDDEHRARFDAIVAQLRVSLDEISEITGHLPNHLDHRFAEARIIAKRLRMTENEFLAAVSVLNTPISRVVNMCPAGKDLRDVPDIMRMTDEELRLSYRLLSPYDATAFIVRFGALWGYSAAEIAKAKREHRPLEQARIARRYAADQARHAAESAIHAARPKSGYTMTIYPGAETLRTYP